MLKPDWNVNIWDIMLSEADVLVFSTQGHKSVPSSSPKPGSKVSSADKRLAIANNELSADKHIKHEIFYS